MPTLNRKYRTPVIPWSAALILGACSSAAQQTARPSSSASNAPLAELDPPRSNQPPPESGATHDEPITGPRPTSANKPSTEDASPAKPSSKEPIAISAPESSAVAALGVAARPDEACPERPFESPQSIQDRLNASAVYQIPIGASTVYGRSDAPVTLIMFASHESEHSRTALQTLKQLMETYKDSLRVVLKFPSYGLSRAAAKAVVAAARQGRSWEMNDHLFSTENPFDDSVQRAQAAAIGLDVGRWDADRKAREVDEVLWFDDWLEGFFSPPGRPTFFVNGRIIVGAQPIETFETAIDDALQRAKTLMAQGVPPAEVYAATVGEGYERAPNIAGRFAWGPETVIGTASYSISEGPKTAKVEIVVWPSLIKRSGWPSFLPLVRRIRRERPRDVRVVWRALPTGLPDDLLAGVAIYAAHEQRAADAMLEALENRTELISRDLLRNLASRLGLNEKQFMKAINSKRLRRFVQEDFKAAQALAVPESGIAYVNGRPSSAHLSLGYHVEQAILEADGHLARGVPLRRLHALLQRRIPRRVKIEQEWKSQYKQAVKASLLAKIRAEERPSQGPRCAPVTILAFWDYGCRFCATADANLRELRRRYGDKVRIVYYFFPQNRHNEFAKLAARASMEAWTQGLFPEMHARLLKSQASLSEDTIFRLMDELDLDVERFKKDLKKHGGCHDPCAVEAIEELGLERTPTFFINGRRIVGAQPFAVFQDAIDLELTTGPRVHEQ
ncbi:MAG: thioredoxin domain-containing protein [Deltaproteobacteria bacterium]|nr:thioredoxin domain-containing protein [Deltaproteobacteria bacterium]